jgi:hypothetical protein
MILAWRRSTKASHLRAILSYGPFCRSDMEKPEAHGKSALTVIQRDFLIRAIKMNAVHAATNLDFQFVDKSVQK